MTFPGKGLLALPAVALLLQCAVQSGGIGNDIPDSGNTETEFVVSSAPETQESGKVASFVDVGSPLVILDSLLQAYPHQITALQIRDGDWSVLIDGEPYFWAGGRMLSREQLDLAENYASYSFRPIPSDLPPLRDLSPEEVDRLNSRIEKRESLQDARHPGFMRALWGMDDFHTAEITVIQTEFLGYRIRIHPGIQEPLERVEEEILRKAETDLSISEWIGELGDSGAYVWREIAGSANRSLHSYGIALDLIPADYQGKQAYWRWAGDFYEEWWAIPYEDRYPVPEGVVNAFQNNGFIWGGKWFLFDQIHFEYRPELLILGTLAQANPSEG